MFKKQLIDDCRLIFGTKKVMFGSCLDRIEQGCLYVDISDVKEKVLDDRIDFVVRCKLGTLYTKDGNPNGWLLGCLKQAGKKTSLQKAVGRFMIIGNETNTRFDNYQGYFTQCEVDCKYLVTVPYDPAEKTRGFLTYFKELLRI